MDSATLQAFSDELEKIASFPYQGRVTGRIFGKKLLADKSLMRAFNPKTRGAPLTSKGLGAEGEAAIERATNSSPRLKKAIDRVEKTPGAGKRADSAAENWFESQGPGYPKSFIDRKGKWSPNTIYG